MNVTVRQLRSFILCAELGSFSDAASAMHITQSALSLQIRQLEENLGLKVFDRTTRRVELSPGGRDLLPVARRVISDLDEMGTRASDLLAGRRGTLKLAVTPSLACSILPGMLSNLRRRMPAVRVELTEAVALPLLEHMEQGGSELALSVRPARDTDFHYESLQSDRLVAVLGANHPIATQRQISWKALADIPYISVTTQSGVWAQSLRAAAAAGVTLQVSLETPSFFTAISFARADLGCAVISQLAIGGASLKGLKVLPLVGPTVTRDIGLLWRNATELSPVAEVFVEVARQTIVSNNKRLGS
jgi:LysR family carnitine catabolism transcriptional activator